MKWKFSNCLRILETFVYSDFFSLFFFMLFFLCVFYCSFVFLYINLLLLEVFCLLCHSLFTSFFSFTSVCSSFPNLFPLTVFSFSTPFFFSFFSSIVTVLYRFLLLLLLLQFLLPLLLSSPNSIYFRFSKSNLGFSLLNFKNKILRSLSNNFKFLFYKF